MDTNSNSILGGDKMFHHLDRVAQWQQYRAGKSPLPFPVTVELNLTNVCNHACPDCSLSYLVNVDHSRLPLALAQQIIDDLALCEVRGVTFSGGGEPLLYGEEHVLSLARRAKGLGMDVALITNGSRLTDPAWWDVLTWLRVSVDGYDEGTYQRFHGRGVAELNRVMVNAVNFGRAKPDRASCTFGIGFLTDHDSHARRDVSRMVRFCDRVPNLDYLQFRPLVNNNVDQRDNPMLSAETLELVEADIACEQRCVGKRTFEIIASSGKYAVLRSRQRSYHQCHGHFLEAAIGADAKVYICCHKQGQSQYCLGDLSHDSFETIWRSAAAEAVFERTKPQLECTLACRLHEHNERLEQIVQPVQHVNFI